MMISSQKHPSIHQITYTCTVSTILSDFLNRIFSPKLEEMCVKIHLKWPKTPKSGFHEIFPGKRVRKQFMSGLLTGYYVLFMRSHVVSIT
jgi:hypothetical protein